MSADAREEDLFENAARILLEKPPFLVLTGAGISVESGLPPFRGPGGIWTRFDPEDYGHIETFQKDPEKAWILLSELVSGSMKATPNEAHFSLSRLQREGLAGPVITQNVDGLHRMAGSTDVIDVHGDAGILFCPACGSREVLEHGSNKVPSPRCSSCGSYRRPDIVFYGESLPEEKIERAWKLSGSGRDMLVIGTSGVVVPVAHLPHLVSESGGRLVVIDPNDIGPLNNIATVHIRQKAVGGMLCLEKSLLCEK